MGWYYIITEEMRALGLKGSDLILFAIIESYSRKDAGCFYGGNTLLGEMAGISVRSAQRSLHRLVESGMVKCEQITHRGKVMMAYSCGVNMSPQDVKICHPKGRKNVTPRDDKSTPNNRDITETTSPKNNKTTTSFVVPSVNDVKQYAESIGHPEFDAEHFVNYYTTTGWRLKGGQPIKNWHACARDWIRRDEKRRQEGNASTTYTSKLNLL